MRGLDRVNNAMVEDLEKNMSDVEVEVINSFTRETGRPEIDKEGLLKYDVRTHGITAGL